ncbi:hypothetical protein V8C37DRAFT_373295 [Trichoderma ceciliae]
MGSFRDISGNNFGNNASVIQGDVQGDVSYTIVSGPDGSFLREISATDPVHDKERIMTLKGPFFYEAFSWILQQHDFKKWREASNGIFWIKGDPGKGKTMLLCGIIEELEKDSTTAANLSYFFCQATDYRINTEVSVLRGLIFSLLRVQPDLVANIQEKYEAPKDQLVGPNAWFFLQDVFKIIIQHPAIVHPICIIDALDECEKHCRLLLDLILETSHRVKWLVSSRNIGRIEQRLQSIPQTLSLELKQNAENVSTAVNAYIDDCVQYIHALEGDEELRRKTLRVLKNKAKGTFLWVALVIEQLREADHRNVEDILEEIPENLESLYGLIVRRSKENLREKDQEACRVLFAIVATAERPLHVKELLGFVQSQWKHAKKTLHQIDICDIAKACGSLLSIQQDTVYLIHQSAKDYIISNLATAVFPSGTAHQQFLMVETSLSEMERVLKYNIYEVKAPGTPIDSILTPSPDPLAPIAYCCVFWVEHLVHLYESLEHQEFLEDNGRVHCFVKKFFLCWLEALLLLHSFMPQAITAGQRLTGILKEREAGDLSNFVNDALRFILYSKDCVTSWPLQLYYSIFTFEEFDSIIRTTFEQDVYRSFEDIPTVMSMQRGRCSLLQTIECAEVDQLVFSPHSHLLGSSYYHGDMVTVWRTDTGDELQTIPVGKKCKIVFSPHSDHLISASTDGVLKVWRIDNGVCITEHYLSLDTSPCPESPDRFAEASAQLIVLSPAGDLVVSLHQTSEDITIAKVWQTTTWDCIGEIPQSSMPMPPYGAFSSDSKLLALTYDKIIETFCAETYKSIQRYHWPWVDSRHVMYFSRPSIIFSSDSKFLAAVATNGRLRLWNAHTGEILHQLEDVLGEEWVLSFAISPDSKTLATSSRTTAYLWDIDTGKRLNKLTDTVQYMSFSPDWTVSRILATSKDDRMEIWRADMDRILQETPSCDYEFNSVLISPDSTIVAAGHYDHGYIGIWSVDTGTRLHVLEGKPRDENEYSMRSNLLAFSLDSELLAVIEGSKNADVRIWRVRTGETVCILRRLDAQVVSAAFSTDSKYLVSGYEDGLMRIWSIESRRCIYEDEDDSYTDSRCNSDAGDQRVISAVAFSPNSKYVASGSDDGIVQVRHFGTTEFPFAFRVRHTRTIDKLSFSHDSTVLMTAAMASKSKRSVGLWSVVNGACLGAIKIPYNHGYSMPIFDSINDQILFDQLAVRKNSSWEHSEETPRRGYSWLGVRGENWIYRNGEHHFRIVREFSPDDNGEFQKLDISDSLVVFVTNLHKVAIIKLHAQREPQRRRNHATDSQAGYHVQNMHTHIKRSSDQKHENRNGEQENQNQEQENRNKGGMNNWRKIFCCRGSASS